jgi:hypothetical protein
MICRYMEASAGETTLRFVKNAYGKVVEGVGKGGWITGRRDLLYTVRDLVKERA